MKTIQTITAKELIESLSDAVSKAVSGLRLPFNKYDEKVRKAVASILAPIGIDDPQSSYEIQIGGYKCIIFISNKKCHRDRTITYGDVSVRAQWKMFEIIEQTPDITLADCLKKMDLFVQEATLTAVEDKIAGLLFNVEQEQRNAESIKEKIASMKKEMEIA
jgi:hypothetical protein